MVDPILRQNSATIAQVHLALLFFPAQFASREIDLLLQYYVISQNSHLIVSEATAARKKMRSFASRVMVGNMESRRDVLISNPVFDRLSLAFVFKIETITSLVVEMMSLNAALTFYLVRSMVRLLMMVEMSTGGQSLYSTDPTESSLYSPAPHEQFQHLQCLQPISSTTL